MTTTTKLVCCRCNGDGHMESLDDRERHLGIMDSCYHCSETGSCDCTPQNVVDSMVAEEEWWRQARHAEQMEYTDFGSYDYEEVPEVTVDELHGQALQYNETLERLGR